MPKQNLLSPVEVQKAKCPLGKRYKWLSDGNGLMLRIDHAQNKFWSVRLYRDTKESIRGIGKYPTIALKEARGIRDTYKNMWANNIDPSIQKQIAKHNIINQTDLTFEKAYNLTLAERIIPHLADKTVKRTKEFYKNFLQIPLGKLPLVNVNDEILLTVLEKVELVLDVLYPNNV